MKRILLLTSLLTTSCAYTPHIADSGVTTAVIASGGTELNPIGFPGVIVAKVAFEGAALAAKESGDKKLCTQIAASARYGSWIGTGATLGGLVLGPPGMALGALIAAASTNDASFTSAITTCYGREIEPIENIQYSIGGWNG